MQSLIQESGVGSKFCISPKLPGGTYAAPPRVGKKYSWLLNSKGVGGPNPLHSQKSVYYLYSALCIWASSESAILWIQPITGRVVL